MRSSPYVDVVVGHDPEQRLHPRRYHLENLVHRVDAEQALGLASEIDGDEAADAVDERFEFVHLLEERPAGSLHVHRTDGEGEDTVVDDRIVVTKQHEKAMPRGGTGADLMLAVWGRGADALEIFGDDALVDEWFSLSMTDAQPSPAGFAEVRTSTS